MQLLPADYVLLAFGVLCALVGLFRGLSGTLAFFVAIGAAVAVGYGAWYFSSSYIEGAWLRALAAFIAALLAFGLARLLVKKLVNGILAQPSDALLGLLVGLLVAVGVACVWARSGIATSYSTLITYLQAQIGGGTAECVSY